MSPTTPEPQAPMPDVAQWWPGIERGVVRRKIRQRRIRSASMVALGVLLTLGTLQLLQVRSSSGALVVSGPEATQLWTTAAGEKQVVHFSDRSSVSLEGGSALSLLQNDGTRVALELSRGKGHFEVTPGGPRAWSVKTRFALVEVVGTAFDVDVQEHGVTVLVDHGIVRVSGALVPGGERRLTAGERLLVTEETPVAAVPEVKPVEPPVEAPGAAPERPRASRVETPPVPPAPTADALWSDAEGLRKSGQRVEAIAKLRELTQRYPGHSQAGLAAFLAGRLTLETRGDAREAAQLFEQSVTLGLERSLVGDAWRRSAEAWTLAGDTARATHARAQLGAHGP